MDEPKQRQLEKVAKDLSDALAASYKACLRENELSPKRDEELTRQFYSLVLRYFAARAPQILAPSDELKMEQSGEAEAWEPSIGLCMDFLDELLSYYRSDPLAV